MGTSSLPIIHHEPGRLDQEPYRDKAVLTGGRHHVKAPAKTKTRDKVLTDREIERVWNSAADMGFPFGPFIRLVLLTGQRRCEVAKLRWSDIDFEKKEWVQPETSNKSRRTHIVPLSEAAIDLLQSLPRFQSEWVFPATSGDHAISGFSKWKAELDRLSHTSGWTIHDLRRTMTTRMAMARVPSVVVELILNHSRRASNPIAAVYNRYDYMDERRTALEEWAKTVIAIAQPSIDLAR